VPIRWFRQSAFVLRAAIAGWPSTADLLLISHEHRDHSGGGRLARGDSSSRRRAHVCDIGEFE
jgi:glyoxylase-like metal-dependent hydrolase (beta-lactamase superfamily II)